MFWFSRRNLTRVITNIKTFFTAVDGDLDNFQTAITDLDDRVQALETAGDPAMDILIDRGEVDIDNTHETVTQRTDAATIVTSFSSDSGVHTITSNITMNEGDYDYIKKVVITPVDDIDQVRTTIQKVAKSS